MKIIRVSLGDVVSSTVFGRACYGLFLLEGDGQDVGSQLVLRWRREETVFGCILFG